LRSFEIAAEAAKELRFSSAAWGCCNYL
jgi:hypothetical protein